MNEFTRANRSVWDAIAKSHYENYHLQKLLAGEPLLSELIRSEVGDVKDKALLHLLCHIGSDTLSWGLLGAQVTGIDISPEAIKYAKGLAEKMKIPANFIISDIMDLLDKRIPAFDIVFASTGVLCWIPDLALFATTIRKLLSSGGFFYLHDSHPFNNMLEFNESGEARLSYDYFQKGVLEYSGFTDYAVKDLVIPHKTYEWSWTLGEIVTSLCQNGMRIAFLNEHPQFFYSGYTGYDVQAYRRELYPCTFSLKAIAE